MKVNFNTIAQGTYSAYPTANQLAISSTAEWVDLWQRHSSNNIPPPPVPEVDFTQDRVIAVFAGEKFTGGYSVEIISVETTNSQLVIIVKHRQPGAEDIVTQVITHPYHIIRIPRMTLERVIFEQV